MATTTRRRSARLAFNPPIQSLGKRIPDFLLFCTQSPDYFLPATACTMQARLGLATHCGALDFNQGCSGFVYGLSLAKGLGVEDVALRTAARYLWKTLVAPSCVKV